jgi:hypothetical protein
MQIEETLATPLVRNVIIFLSLLVAIYVALIVRYNILRHKRLMAIKRNKQKIIEERQRQYTHDVFED